MTDRARPAATDAPIARTATTTSHRPAATGIATSAHDRPSGSKPEYGSLNALQWGAACTRTKPTATLAPTAAAYGAASRWPRAMRTSSTASATQPAARGIDLEAERPALARVVERVQDVGNREQERGAAERRAGERRTATDPR